MSKLSRIVCLLLIILFWPKISAAYQIDSVEGVSVSGDFVLGQGKNEVSLNPGDEKIRDVFILNRSGRDLDFMVSVENFYNSDQPQETIKFSNEQAASYPARNFLIPEVLKFSLKQGEKMTLPVLVRIAKDTPPGGLYGAVMVSAQPSGASTGSQVKTTSRLASLFFVKVNGDINEVGNLEKFSSPKSFYNRGPVELFFSFKNTGNIYLNPHGEITITSLFGKRVYRQAILPYFVMPGSTRQQKEVWQSGANWGIYKATINLSRGYGEMIDRRSINLYIFSWTQLVIGGVILLALIILIARLVTRPKKQ